MFPGQGRVEAWAWHTVMSNSPDEAHLQKSYALNVCFDLKVLLLRLE